MNELLMQLEQERALHQEALELFLKVGMHKNSSLGLLRKIQARIARRSNRLEGTQHLVKMLMCDFILDHQHYDDETWVAIV